MPLHKKIKTTQSLKDSEQESGKDGTDMLESSSAALPTSSETTTGETSEIGDADTKEQSRGSGKSLQEHPSTAVTPSSSTRSSAKRFFPDEDSNIRQKGEQEGSDPQTQMVTPSSRPETAAPSRPLQTSVAALDLTTSSQQRSPVVIAPGTMEQEARPLHTQFTAILPKPANVTKYPFTPSPKGTMMMSTSYLATSMSPQNVASPLRPYSNTISQIPMPTTTLQIPETGEESSKKRVSQDISNNDLPCKNQWETDEENEDDDVTPMTGAMASSQQSEPIVTPPTVNKRKRRKDYSMIWKYYTSEEIEDEKETSSQHPSKEDSAIGTASSYFDDEKTTNQGEEEKS